MQNKPGVYVETLRGDVAGVVAGVARGDLVEIGNADQAGELYVKDSVVHAWMKRREQAIDAMHALAPSLPKEGWVAMQDPGGGWKMHHANQFSKDHMASIVARAAAEAGVGVCSFSLQDLGRGVVVRVFATGTNAAQRARMTEVMCGALPFGFEVTIEDERPTTDDVISGNERRDWREMADKTTRALCADVELLHMSRARLREQVASGGVDCKETRKVNLRRVKAEHRAVIAMQDAVRMVEAWPSKRERCAFCAGPKERGYATCSYCGHGLKLRMLGAERDGGIATLTPGPHEGATAWASSTWEEL